ncbi:MFS transporter [Streptomyces celluloflavus]|uniref:MFS transporter n=1 Tax=Streptomyces celluloflavus TaxID=58344 RepID=UPI003667F337
MKKGQLGFLTSTHVVNDLYQGFVPALLPYLASERHYSYAATTGITLAATGLSSVVQPVFGAIADRRYRGWLIPAGFVVAAVGIALSGPADNYVLTWLAIALSGIGVAAYHPPATNAARAAGGSSQQAMSWFSVGGTVGGSLAPPLVTLVVGATGLSGTWLLATPALVMAVLWALSGPWMRARGHTPARPVVRPAGETAVRSAHRDDWRAFGRLAAATVCWSVPYVTTTSFLSLYITRDLDGSKVFAAVVLTTFTAAGAVGTVAGGWIADRWGRLVPVRIGYVLALPALGGLILAPNPVVAEVCTMAFGLSMFLPFAPQVTLAQDYLPNRPGTASGVTLGLAMSVGGLLSPLFGMLADARGLTTTLTGMLVVLVAACALALRMRDRDLSTEPPTGGQSPGPGGGGDGAGGGRHGHDDPDAPQVHTLVSGG